MPVDCLSLQGQISSKTLECSQLQEDYNDCQTELTSLWMIYWMYCSGMLAAGETVPKPCCGGEDVQASAKARADWLMANPERFEAWKRDRLAHAKLMQSALET